MVRAPVAPHPIRGPKRRITGAAAIVLAGPSGPENRHIAGDRANLPANA
jgi:hypothetical protein